MPCRPFVYQRSMSSSLHSSENTKSTLACLTAALPSAPCGTVQLDTAPPIEKPKQTVPTGFSSDPPPGPAIPVMPTPISARAARAAPGRGKAGDMALRTVIYGGTRQPFPMAARTGSRIGAGDRDLLYQNAALGYLDPPV